ncbi:MAG TPA: RNA polymerase sigma factor [Burkholderiales bacterium]
MTRPSALTAAAPPADTELVERIRAGDTAAMEALMRRHNRILYRTARAILKDDAEAEEAVQDAYLKAFGALEGFRAESKLSTWLVRIAANEALMRRRRRARGAEVIPLNGMEEPMDHAEGPEQAAGRGELRRVLEARIDRLPDDYRAVFVLRALEELSVEDTASALDIPEATVRTRFFRARALLRDSLAREVDLTLENAFAFDGERCDRMVANVLKRTIAGT